MSYDFALKIGANIQSVNSIVKKKSSITMEEKSDKFQTLGYESIERTWTKAHMNGCAICYLITKIILLLNCLTFSVSNIMQCHIETKRDSFRMRPYRLSP